jgi:hypothetical protein
MAVVWVWRNGFAYPLSLLGRPGKCIAAVLYPVLLYLPGMALAFIAYALYPPKGISPRTVKRGAAAK